MTAEIAQRQLRKDSSIIMRGLDRGERYASELESPRKHRFVNADVATGPEWLDAGRLLIEVAIRSITMAELAAGPQATRRCSERAEADLFTASPRSAVLAGTSRRT
jgi:hypothetical protein